MTDVQAQSPTSLPNVIHSSIDSDMLSLYD
jgi:hypothetical protein